MFKHILILFIAGILLRMLPSSAQFSTHPEATALPGEYKTSRVLVNTSLPSGFSQYGGNLSVISEPTGFFRIEKINDEWFIIDPAGHGFLTIGVNSVSKGGGRVLPDELWEIACNTLACWSDETINTGVTKKMPYTPRWNFMLTFKNTTQRRKDLYAAGIIPVFDPEFSTFCDSHVSQIAGLQNDPFLLGHFSDNELPIYDNSTYGNLLDRFLQISDKNDPNYLAANAWMVSRKGQGYVIDAADREEFHGHVAGTYYMNVNAALKKYDPNHLYLGSRLHGAAKYKPSIFREAGKFVDIISINCYSVWTPSVANMDMWAGESGKPFIVTEFYAKSQDSGLDNLSGAGWLVKTQTDRSRFFQNFTLALLEHPGCVGYHYFRYTDKDGINCGLQDYYYQWWEPARNAFADIGRNVYELRNFLMYGWGGEGVATVYAGTNFTREAVLLKPGEYSANALEALGLSWKKFLSFRIKDGDSAVVYSEPFFTGDSIIITENKPDMTDYDLSFNNISFRISGIITSIGDYNLSPRQGISYYPNPAEQWLMVRLPHVPEMSVVEMISQTGRLVLQQKTTGIETIFNIVNLPSGPYLIKVSQGTDIYMNKFIKK